MGEQDGANALDLTFTSSGPEISEVALMAGYEVPAIGPFDFTGQVTGVEDGAEFRDLDVRVGRSDLKGTMKVVTADPTRFDVDLTSGVLELTPLFRNVEVVDDTNEEDTSADDQIYSPEPLPIDSLAAVDADIKLAVKRLLVRGTWFDVAEAKVSLKGGDLKIDPLKLSYKNAIFTGRGSIDAGRHRW